MPSPAGALAAAPAATASCASRGAGAVVSAGTLVPGASGTAVRASGCRVSAVRTCGDLSSGALTSGAVLPVAASGFTGSAAPGVPVGVDAPSPPFAGSAAGAGFAASALALAAAWSASALLRIGVFGSKPGTAMPCCSASRRPRRVGSPGPPSATAPSRSSAKPASCTAISFSVQSRAPRVGIGRPPARSSSTTPSAPCGSTLSKKS